MARLSEHFQDWEFWCPCCRKLAPEGVSPKLLAKLEEIRAALGNVPVSITCGYRCPKHNEALRKKGIKAAKFSRHTIVPGRNFSDAADFVVKDTGTAEVAYQIAHLVKNCGFHTYPGFTHCDVRGYRARWK